MQTSSHMPKAKRAALSCFFERKRIEEKRVARRNLVIFVLILISGLSSSIFCYQSYDVACMKHKEAHLYDNFFKIDKTAIYHAIELMIFLAIYGKAKHIPIIKKYIVPIVPGIQKASLPVLLFYHFYS